MADWSSLLQPRDYLEARDRASGRVAEKLNMRKQVVKTPVGAAAIEGAVGGALAGASFMGAMNGAKGPATDKTPEAGLQPKTGGTALTPAQAATYKTPASGLSAKTGGAAVTPAQAGSSGGFSSFFSFFK